MSKKVFTEKEIKLLSTNNFVKSISSKGITYTDEFKHLFIAENDKGKFPREIFEECGFDVDVLEFIELGQRVGDGKEPIGESGVFGLRDTRAGNSRKS